jgi:hypothetical protein
MKRRAARAASKYLRRKLAGRRGIKWELEAIQSESPDIWREIVHELAQEFILFFKREVKRG